MPSYQTVNGIARRMCAMYKRKQCSGCPFNRHKSVSCKPKFTDDGDIVQKREAIILKWYETHPDASYMELAMLNFKDIEPGYLAMTECPGVLFDTGKEQLCNCMSPHDPRKCIACWNKPAPPKYQEMKP